MMWRFLVIKNAAFAENAEKIMPLWYSGHHSELRNNPLRAARYSSLQGAGLEQFFVSERRDLPNRERARRRKAVEWEQVRCSPFFGWGTGFQVLDE